MAGGTSNGNSRELEQTPTWVVAAVVNAVIIIISTAWYWLKALHKFGEWITDERNRNALVGGLEKVKAGVGFLLEFLSWPTETLRGKLKMTTIDESVVVRAKWSYTDEKILVGLMVDQKKGKGLTTPFSTKAWHDHLMSEFHKKTGKKYGRQQFMNKINKMRRVYKEFKKLRDIPTGFSWDPKTKTVTAPDDVWDDYIKKYKRAKQFRTKGCPLFDELEIIYGDTTATGENAEASTQGAVDADDENSIAPLRNQTSPDQDHAVDVDDDANFVDGEAAREARSQFDPQYESQMPACFQDFENRLFDQSTQIKLLKNLMDSQFQELFAQMEQLNTDSHRIEGKLDTLLRRFPPPQ